MFFRPLNIDLLTQMAEKKKIVRLKNVFQPFYRKSAFYKRSLLKHYQIISFVYKQLISDH